MSEIRNLIARQIVAPSVSREKPKYTIAIVTSTDEARNSCTITYKNSYGKVITETGAQVRLYGDGTSWFPAVGDKAIVQFNSSVPTIIARHIGNYDMDIRSKKELKQDKHSDYNACMEAGGEIM